MSFSEEKSDQRFNEVEGSEPGPVVISPVK